MSLEILYRYSNDSLLASTASEMYAQNTKILHPVTSKEVLCWQIPWESTSQHHLAWKHQLEKDNQYSQQGIQEGNFTTIKFIQVKTHLTLWGEKKSTQNPPQGKLPTQLGFVFPVWMFNLSSQCLRNLVYNGAKQIKVGDRQGPERKAEINFV